MMSELEVNAESFKEVGSRWVTGVAVVTTISDGFDHAMTGNSFSTVSVDPMQVLMCIETNTRFHDALCTTEDSHSVGGEPRRWAMSILSADAAPTASWFATKGRPLVGQFDRIAHHRGPITSAIILDEAIASLELRTVHEFVSGDHVIVVGQVLGLATRDPARDEADDDPAARPLTYWARRYRNLTP